MTTPTFRLDGAAVLVTGAGSGIGARTAIGLAEFGASVGCLDRSKDGLEETVDAIKQAGGQAIVLEADVTEAEQLASAVDQVEKDLGPLNAALNCAGSRSLALEWADRGVRVNVVSPGYTATPMARHPDVWEHVKHYIDDIPLGRMAETDELVGPAVFLLSDASSYCTGIEVLCDGGACAW